MTRRGRVYTPESTQLYEQTVRDAYGDGPKFTGPVAVSIVLAVDHTRVLVCDEKWSSPLRGDIDNYAKAILDGLQPEAFDNDRQVTLLVVEKS